MQEVKEVFKYEKLISLKVITAAVLGNLLDFVAMQGVQVRKFKTEW